MDLAAKLELYLTSIARGGVPKGSYQAFFVERITDFFERMEKGKIPTDLPLFDEGPLEELVIALNNLTVHNGLLEKNWPKEAFTETFLLRCPPFLKALPHV